MKEQQAAPSTPKTTVTKSEWVKPTVGVILVPGSQLFENSGVDFDLFS
ncbi:MAG: hypothetical protein WDM91_08105 [Rhizomicrobium sp.]